MPQRETNADAIRGAEVFGVSKVSQRANPSHFSADLSQLKVLGVQSLKSVPRGT